MSGFLQQLINGLSIGSVYALMAVGYPCIQYNELQQFRPWGRHNDRLLHRLCDDSLQDALCRRILYSGTGYGALAVLIERIAYSPLRRRNAPFLYFIISAMGISIFMENIIIASPIGPTFRTYPRVFGMEPFKIGGVNIGRLDVMMFVISTISLIILVFIIEKTRTGMGIRASAYNLRASALMGVNTDRIILIVFGLGGLLAGIAGVLFGMKYTVYPQIGNITLKSFIAAVFGGLGSLPGAVIGSVLLGIIETFTSGYLSSQFRDLIAFVLLIFILVVRPRGLMGKTTEEKA